MKYHTALLAKLSEATEGSRELDHEVQAATFGQVSNFYGQGDKTPFYTTSLDAALTLVPENWDWVASRYTDLTIMRTGYTAVLERLSGDGDREPLQMLKLDPAIGASAPLALCLACLKARQSE